MAQVPNNTIRILATIAVIAALIFTPSPLLPPHFLAEKIQHYLQLPWNVAYMIAVVGCQCIFYFSIGLMAAFMAKPQANRRSRWPQLMLLPVLVVLISLLIRSLKLGHFPIWINAAIPAVAILAGAFIGLGIMYRRSLVSFVVVALVAGLSWLALTTSATPELRQSTVHKLQQLAQVNTSDTSGDTRFELMLKKAFEQNNAAKPQSAVQQNRSALLALGIAIGHEYLAKYVQLQNQSSLLLKAAQLRETTTLRGRNDWARHFCLSAALAVLENSLVSDAGGLLKEQMDAFSGGSGFSFADFAADRAGVRFAMAATHSEQDAISMQQFIQQHFTIGSIFPAVADLPEHMSMAEFNNKYGSTGSEVYRNQVALIEQRLDSCVALTPLTSSKLH